MEDRRWVKTKSNILEIGFGRWKLGQNKSPIRTSISQLPVRSFELQATYVLNVLNASTSVSGRRRFSLRNFFPFPLACRPTSPMLLSGLCSAHDRPDPPISKAFPCREKHRLVLKLLNPSRCPHWPLSQVWNPDRWRCAIFPGASRGRCSNRAPYPKGFPEILRPSHSGSTIFADRPVPFSLP